MAERPDIQIKVLENGYIVEATWRLPPTGESRYPTIERKWVAYNGTDLDKTITELKTGQLVPAEAKSNG